MRYVVILAGGSGTRLWPLSRKGMPKQLLELVGGVSLLRMAYERVARVVPAERILVCTGASYADVVAEQLPELAPENLLGEPVGRDSLNAIAWSAAVLADRDPDAVVATVTADHVIEPVDAFVEALEEAFSVAEENDDALVTFGVVPTTAHTGYGYLHRGDGLDGHPSTCEVREFKEKPDAATAERYLASGQYWWNSGMFVWQARTFLDQLAGLVPESYRIVTELATHPAKLAGLYPQLPRISVDYAVLEPVSQGRGSARILAVALPIQWSDVGGYAALAEHLPTDADGNAVDGRAVLLDSSDTVVVNRTSPEHVVAVVGGQDLIVVTTADITLVCPASAAEQVKALVAEVGEQLGDDYT
ncbi:MAG TPA: mannose-1-phosphate guanylyltransferase [Candidatus Avipropionibacterium avicola]|uniref:Mannose-1-phosphate guanylyltransferase n=1 Tax=Candidatus Avipropionibacterium avicola TaxID=2840701 RepID=A0A9D1GYU0_9ACTN|nr:mannose-1-phosphate guanylyltransferase [Candidatus Avipropionibacterium avicola]